MNLDEAAHLAALYKGSIYRYWKNKVTLAYLRGLLPLEPTEEEVKEWLTLPKRKQVTVHFDQDLYSKMQERFTKYGEMSDFVNKVVREAL